MARPDEDLVQEDDAAFRRGGPGALQHPSFADNIPGRGLPGSQWGIA